MSSITYQIGRSLYLNITNQCTSKCQFCIRYKTKLFNSKHELWIKKEPTAQQVIDEIGIPRNMRRSFFADTANR